MKNEKFVLTNEFVTIWDGRKLYRIKALKDLPNIGVKSGDLGGFVESEKILTYPARRGYPACLW